MDKFKTKKDIENDEESEEPILYSVREVDAIENSVPANVYGPANSKCVLPSNLTADNQKIRNVINRNESFGVMNPQLHMDETCSAIPVNPSYSFQTTPPKMSHAFPGTPSVGVHSPNVNGSVFSTTTISDTTISETASASSESQVQGVKMPISGVTVEFPIQPYGVQIYMMNQILSAVKYAQNCLLESPTGTGKTLALLCSTLSWQRQERELNYEIEATLAKEIVSVSGKKTNIKDKEKESKETSSISTKPAESLDTCHSDSDSEKDVFQSPKRRKKSLCSKDFQNKLPEPQSTPQEHKKSPKNKEKAIEELQDDSEKADTKFERVPVAKIFYGTRTHKQIAQVVAQLKKTSHADRVKMTVLAARDHTCINGMVRDKPNITDLCQALIDPVHGKGCSYYTGTNRSICHEALEGCGLPIVYDIEDMLIAARRKRVCPYFTLRHLIVQSNIIFCPYNYLIDPRIRKAMDINISRAVVIMDEAHNIEDVCRESGSLLLKQTDLEIAIKECKENISKEIHPAQYKAIEDYLQRLNDWLSDSGVTESFSSTNESLTVISGQDLINKLHVVGLSSTKFEEFLESVNHINAKPADQEEMFVMRGVVRQVTVDISVVFHYLFEPQFMDKYQAFFCREICDSSSSQQLPGGWLTKHKWKNAGEGSGRVWKYMLNLLCLSPSVVFSQLTEARSIIVASGTLSPLDSFQCELGVKFPYIVKGRHVVSRENLFVSTVTAGPRRVELKGIYENSMKYEYQDELGKTILATSRVIPHGVLCFFQSYFLMEKLRERWESTGLLDELNSLKEVFWEPRHKLEMNNIMNEFNERITLSSRFPNEEKGAIMFGVYRGKIAEGIDFSDDSARVVIAVGIPFLNRKSMEINLKMKFNDVNAQKVENYIPGNRWYKIQAFRALNQALGRCIRHKNDWAAIILLDARFALKDIQINLPVWIQQPLQTYQNWDKYLNDISMFCDRMKRKQMASHVTT